MARKQLTQIVDDISGDILTSEEAQEVLFSFEGRHYSLDLGQENAERFRQEMSEWINHAKREHSPVSEIPKARRKGGSGRDALELAQIRRWARANGYELSDRGRISKEILNAYDAR